MTMQIETNEDNQKEAEKDGNKKMLLLWIAAFSPVIWFWFIMLLGIFGQDIWVMVVLGLLWTATVGIIVPFVLIYFSWQHHYKDIHAAILLLLLNIGIAWCEFIFSAGVAG